MMTSPQPADGQMRIGVAIAVPAPFGPELQRARERFGDPLAAHIPPHITLLGPTVVDVVDLPAIHQHLRQVATLVPSFVIHLRSSGTFRPVSDVVFAQVAQGIAECELLERLVRSGPLQQDLRFHYHPHVTVAHDIAESALNVAFEEIADYEASFAVNEFQLYEHGDDDVWRAVEPFRLGTLFDDTYVTERITAPADAVED